MDRRRGWKKLATHPPPSIVLTKLEESTPGITQFYQRKKSILMVALGLRLVINLYTGVFNLPTSTFMEILSSQVFVAALLWLLYRVVQNRKWTYCLLLLLAVIPCYLQSFPFLFYLVNIMILAPEMMPAVMDALLPLWWEILYILLNFIDCLLLLATVLCYAGVKRNREYANAFFAKASAAPITSAAEYEQ